MYARVVRFEGGEGDATLNTMSPPGEGLGKRAAVEMYEVAVDVMA